MAIDPGVRRELEELFEGELSHVLTSPSRLSREEAGELAKSMPLERALEDLGTIVARLFAQGLIASGLRPGDYDVHPELPSVLAARIAKELGTGEDGPFAKGFRTHLTMRG